MNNESAFWGSVFTMLIPTLERIVRNEPNLDCFQHKYRRSDAKNLGSLCFMVHEKIDRHGENMSVFFHEKKTLKNPRLKF